MKLSFLLKRFSKRSSLFIGNTIISKIESLLTILAYLEELLAFAPGSINPKGIL